MHLMQMEVNLIYASHAFQQSIIFAFCFYSIAHIILYIHGLLGNRILYMEQQHNTESQLLLV